ncbi:MAG: ATP-binding protein [Planctomycetota bacterium]
MSFDQKTPEDILIYRGVFTVHARAAAAVIQDCDDEYRCHLDRLLEAPDQHDGRGLIFIIGERGRGKTQMAACLLRDCLTRRKWSVRYTPCGELHMAFRDALRQGREIDTLYAWAEQRVLIIDDLHLAAGTDHELRTLTLLVDRRLANGKLTVFISNNRREQLAQVVGASIGSRFHEAGLVIEVTGQNYRQGGGGQ